MGAVVGANATGRGGIASLAGVERNVPSTVEFERLQVTSGSLSFPVNALAGLFVGSDNPLYYIYTTFRSEVAFFQNYPTMRGYAHGDSTVEFDRFLGGALHAPQSARAFQPGGPLSFEAGRYTV